MPAVPLETSARQRRLRVDFIGRGSKKSMGIAGNPGIEKDLQVGQVWKRDACDMYNWVSGSYRRPRSYSEEVAFCSTAATEKHEVESSNCLRRKRCAVNLHRRSSANLKTYFSEWPYPPSLLTSWPGKVSISFEIMLLDFTLTNISDNFKSALLF